MSRQAGPGSGPDALCGLQKDSSVVTPEGKEPGGDFWAPGPAGRPGFADTAQELMGENLLSTGDFLNWHFFTLKQARRKDEIVISKGFFFSFHTPPPPF